MDTYVHTLWKEQLRMYRCLRVCIGSTVRYTTQSCLYLLSKNCVPHIATGCRCICLSLSLFGSASMTSDRIRFCLSIYIYIHPCIYIYTYVYIHVNGYVMCVEMSLHCLCFVLPCLWFYEPWICPSSPSFVASREGSIPGMLNIA